MTAKILIILHGAHSSPDSNWYRQLARSAAGLGYGVFIPDLGFIENINLMKTFRELTDSDAFNENTVIVGHSAGAVYGLKFLQWLGQGIKIRKAIFVAGFMNIDLKPLLFREVRRAPFAKLFTDKWDWHKIKNSCRSFVIIQSENDPYVPRRQALTLGNKLSGRIVLVPKAQHFSRNTGGEVPPIIRYLD